MTTAQAQNRVRTARGTGARAALSPVRLLSFWCVLLGLVGLLHRRMIEPAQATSSLHSTPDLDSVPLQLGEWEGIDLPMDARVVAVARTDAHLNRRYISRDSRAAVDLYVAYAHRAANMLGHRPDVCYPANGWIAEGVNTDRVAGTDGAAFDCLLHRFSRGDSEGERLVVLNYYILPDATTTDWNAFAGLQWRRLPTGDEPPVFVAQVQVVGLALFPSHVSATTDSLKHFARAFAPEMAAALTRFTPATAEPVH